MQAVRSRLAEGLGALEARAREFESRAPVQHRQRLMRQALGSNTASQRIHWLRRESDLVAAAAAGLSPCRAGCSHCCHMGTFVAEPEAVAISKAIGVSLSDVLAGRVTRASDVLQGGKAMEHAKAVREMVHDEFYGVPCTFLVDGSCSIYKHRPMACRYLVNLDVDALLCRLVPGETIEARYLNMQRQQAGYVAAMGMNARIADIRDWFPAR
jgi:Fe-S-cluster containining protein